MRIDASFPRQLARVLLGVTVCAAYPLVVYASLETIVAVVAGAAMGALNAIAGFMTIEYAFEKSYTTFLKAVLGGMGIRMLALLGAMLLAIMVVQLPAVPLTVSLLGFYMVFLVMEVLYLQKKVVLKN